MSETRKPIVRRVARRVDWERGAQRTLLDYVAPACLEPRRKDHVASGPLLARHFAVVRFLTPVRFGYLQEMLGNLPGVHVTQVIHPLSGEESRRVMERSARAARATRQDARMLAADAEAALEDADRTQRRLARDQERVNLYGLYVQVTALTPEELEARTQAVRAQLANTQGLALEAVALSFRQKQAFDACLPGGVDPLEQHNLVDTTAIACGFPFDATSLSLSAAAAGSRPAYFYGLTVDRERRTGSAVLLDPFDEEALLNPHAAVLATSGAGKSYLVKSELLQALTWGRRVFVMDPEHEYQGLAEAVGGTFVRIAPGTAARVNPFDLPRLTVDDEEERDALQEKVYSLSGWLEAVLYPHESVPRARRAQIEEAIRAAYRRQGISADPTTHRLAPPTLEDLLPRLRETTNDDDLAAALERLTGGPYAMFNGQTNVDLTAPLVVWGFRDIDPSGGDEMLNLACLLAFDQVWTHARNRPSYAGDPLTVVVDEGWLLFATKVGGAMLSNTARRGRKYNLRLVLATQKVEDVIASEMGRTVLGMVYTKFLLRMEPKEVELAAETFRLNEGERDFLNGCQRTSEHSDCLLLVGPQRVGLRILRAPQLTHRLITTRPGER